MSIQNPDVNQNTESSSTNFLRAIAPYSSLTLIIIVLIFVLIAFRSDIQGFVNNNALDNYDSMLVSNGFHSIALADGRSWKVSYETNPSQEFSGIVRHTSRIKEGKFAILSHDILVTTGDFQNSALVSTSVSNHHFIWHSKNGLKPQGSINLLHTFPMNQTVFDQLLEIENGDQVLIKGYEIYRIQAWDKSHEYLGYWQDSGCNTILVTEVFFQ